MLLFLFTSKICLASYELGPCDYSSKISNQLNQSIVDDNYELFVESFENGACINGQAGNVDDNPLFRAIRFRRVKMVKFLLSNGAFTEYLSKENKTPLMVAVKMQNNMEVIKELNKGGAKINQKVFGISPLDCAFGAGMIISISMPALNLGVKKVFIFYPKLQRSLRHGGQEGHIELITK